MTGKTICEAIAASRDAIRLVVIHTENLFIIKIAK
ncbi:hypothetical protein SPAB_04921 [Salmonella enterica subsp. enterica serovar Paratyphi B str. SPB7]|uniref:Uncharacterized protein n=1 Tax=Salmonella paratyphi B (strain ATCC BAA-1250 / SPB7) TaxID=1016998 RepID=A0A6C6Z861_SALPB|nr:hypothetical protein SPAB_04921 [Salmonella enterica subsp. enterica serovar Paratyphi B str. SPB7]